MTLRTHVARLGGSLALVLSLALVPAPVPVLGATSSFSSVMKGAFAGVSWQSGDAYNAVYIERAEIRSGSATTEMALVSYFVKSDDGYQAGACTIPSDSLTLSRRNASINIDTSTLPLGVPGGEASCWFRDGPGGPITLRVNATDQFQASFNGHAQQRFTNPDTGAVITMRHNGRSDQTSALATGSVLGSAVPTTASGAIGEHHSVTRTIEKAP